MIIQTFGTHYAAAGNQHLAESQSSKIAFASNRDGTHQIYIMDPDGTNQRRLTQTSSNESQPSWSPDGTRIAFVSDRDRRNQIYIMNVDGTDAKRLTGYSLINNLPSWHPNGSDNIFRSKAKSNTETIYVIKPNQLSDQSRKMNSVHNTGPSWSRWLKKENK